MFIEKFNTELALKISQAKYKNGRPVVDLPFYAIQSFLENMHWVGGQGVPDTVVVE